MLQVLLFLALTATICFAQGVKGGYHSLQSEALVSFPAKESGTCYKRVPYTQALAANISKGYVQTVPGTQDSQQGFKSGRPSVITIIDCCDGFVRNSETGECETHCDEGCFGGVCTGPNICTCDTGYTAQAGICTPVCTRPCPFNSICHGPDECKCNVGYIKENGECKAECPDGCINGDCISPKVCQCKHGFQLNKALNECFPVCEGGCPHGDCIGPAFCRCYPGYENAPGDQETCVPQCPKGCFGGTCLVPGLCKCEEGYNLVRNNTCEAICKNGCDNGRCVMPDKCACNSGFNFDDDTQNCVSSINEPYGQRVTVLHQESGNYGNLGAAQNKQEDTLGQQTVPFRQIPGRYNQQSGFYIRGQQAGNYQDAGQQTVNLDQQSVSFGQQAGTRGQQLGSYNQQSGTHGHQSGAYGQQSGTYGHQSGAYGHQSGAYDQQTETHGHQSEVYGHQSGSYGQQSETHGHQSGTYGQQSGTYGQQSGAYGHQSGAYGHQSGAYGHQSGTYGQHSGSLGQETVQSGQHLGTYNQHAGHYNSERGHQTPYDPVGQVSQQTNLEVENFSTNGCTKQCVNGICSGNECQCNRGYMLDVNDPTETRCIPICYGGCRNGVCTAPNVCLCNAGFERDRSVKGRSHCIPITY